MEEVSPLYCQVGVEVQVLHLPLLTMRGWEGSLWLLDKVGFQGLHMPSIDTVYWGVLVTTEYWWKFWLSNRLPLTHPEKEGVGAPSFSLPRVDVWALPLAFPGRGGGSAAVFFCVVWLEYTGYYLKGFLLLLLFFVFLDYPFPHPLARESRLSFKLCCFLWPLVFVGCNFFSIQSGIVEAKGNLRELTAYVLHRSLAGLLSRLWSSCVCFIYNAQRF